MDPEARYASPDEAREAIEALRDADHAKLMLIARLFVRSRGVQSEVGAEDLVQEAIAKTLAAQPGARLEGTRRWNKNISMIKHLDRVMESDSGHIAEKRATRRTARLPAGRSEEEVELRTPYDRLEAVDEAQAVLHLFADHKVALDILLLKGEGFSASQIQRKLGINPRQYESATKLIRRRLAKHLTEGAHQP
jgi:DNA-directed RNA polymerase specialized sigma24 family protein